MRKISAVFGLFALLAGILAFSGKKHVPPSDLRDSPNDFGDFSEWKEKTPLPPPPKPVIKVYPDLEPPAGVINFKSTDPKLLKFADEWNDCVAFYKGLSLGSKGGSAPADNSAVRYPDSVIKLNCREQVAKSMAFNLPPLGGMKTTTTKLADPNLKNPCYCEYKNKQDIGTYKFDGGTGYMKQLNMDSDTCRYTFFYAAMGSYQLATCIQGNVIGCGKSLKSFYQVIDTAEKECIKHICIPLKEFTGRFPGDNPRCDYPRYEQSR